MTTRKEPYTKAYLCEVYNLKPGKLGYLMNQLFYDELVLVGYRKLDSQVPPKVVQKFAELWGTPEEHLI